MTAKNSIHNEHGPPEHAARPAAASSVAPVSSGYERALRPCREPASAPHRRVSHSEPSSKPGLIVDYDVPVPMRDGTVLATDVFRPAALGRYPVILVRTPYDKLAEAARLVTFGVDPLAAVRAGYVVVIQDVRGAFASQGRFRHFRDESDDGAVSVGWAASQEWSDGAVAMAGGSYLGAAQLLAAIRTPPALKAIAPVITASEYYEGWTYQGGAFQLGFALVWAAGMAYADLGRRNELGEDVTADREVLESIVADPWDAFKLLPLAELPRRTRLLANYGEWLSHPDRDEFWRATAINEHYGSIDVPALHIAGWHDIFLKGSLENYMGLRAGAASAHARDNQRLIVAPWGHALPNEFVGDVWFGAAANPMTLNLHASHLEFFDAFLKGEPLVERAPVRIFVMGANLWRDEENWPIARAVQTRFYLRAGGKLTREAPAEEAADDFVYDPRDPVPTVGGNTLLPGGGFFMGPRDRRSIEGRPDVLVYTTDMLAEDVEVTGPMTARLQVTTSARDTDFTVALVDVYPDGRAIGIADGILRLRYRNGFETQHLAEPAEVYEIEIELGAISNLFQAGHRIRVEVASSNFPRFDRNPNHGGTIAEANWSDFVVATQRILHDANRASYITLPVIPG